MTTLIRGGRIVRGTGIETADLLVKEGRITEIGTVSHDAEETIDASGLLVFPGLIDTQVHFREPGLEHKEDIATGSRAALLGGVTSFLEMPNTSPPTTDPGALADKLRRAEGRSWASYGFFVGATAENAERLAEYETLPGTPGIKLFMGSSTGGLLVESDADVRRVLKSGHRRMPVHSEDEPRNRAARAAYQGHDPADHPHVRDAESARLSTERLLRLSAETGRDVHVLHISTADELPMLREARRTLGTTCEITPQHLWFSADDYARLGTRLQMNPPIRSREHRDALRAAVNDGLFAVFGSDHAPHTLDEKAKPYPASPSGMPGVQTLLLALLTLAREGIGTVEGVARMAAENAAALYGIAGKGRIEVGFDADLVLVDPNATTVMDAGASRCGWSPYEGVAFRGRVERVLLNGESKVIAGEIVGEPTGKTLRFGPPGTVS